MSERFDMIAALTTKQQTEYREARELGANVDEAIAYALESTRTLDLPGHEKPGHWFDTNRNGFSEENE